MSRQQQQRQQDQAIQRRQDQAQQRSQQAGEGQQGGKQRPSGGRFGLMRSRTDRHGRVKRAVLIFDLVFLAIFLASAGTTGYFALVKPNLARHETIDLSSRQRALLAAGFAASIAGALSSIMCVGTIHRGGGVPFRLDAPWFVPFVISLLAMVPAVWLGVVYNKNDKVLGQSPVKKDQELAGFAVALGVVGVTVPWLGSAAVSWVK